MVTETLAFGGGGVTSSLALRVLRYPAPRVGVVPRSLAPRRTCKPDFKGYCGNWEPGLQMGYDDV